MAVNKITNLFEDYWLAELMCRPIVCRLSRHLLLSVVDLLSVSCRPPELVLGYCWLGLGLGYPANINNDGKKSPITVPVQVWLFLDFLLSMPSWYSLIFKDEFFERFLFSYLLFERIKIFPGWKKNKKRYRDGGLID